MTQRWNAFKIAFFSLLAQWWSTLPTLWFTSRLGAHLFLTMWHSEPYRESAMMRQITRVPYRALVICPSLHSPASHQWHIPAIKDTVHHAKRVTAERSLFLVSCFASFHLLIYPFLICVFLSFFHSFLYSLPSHIFYSVLPLTFSYLLFINTLPQFLI